MNLKNLDVSNKDLAEDYMGIDAVTVGISVRQPMHDYSIQPARLPMGDRLEDDYGYNASGEEHSNIVTAVGTINNIPKAKFWIGFVLISVAGFCLYKLTKNKK